MITGYVKSDKKTEKFEERKSKKFRGGEKFKVEHIKSFSKVDGCGNVFLRTFSIFFV